MDRRMKHKLTNLILIGISAAIIAVFSQISVPLPFSPVMFTMQIFGVMVCSIVLGGSRAVVTVLVYLMLGAAGLPVFSSYRGGFGVLAGPTGGYLLAYIPMSLIIGMYADRNKKDSIFSCMVSILMGMLVCYAVGSVQLAAVTGISYQKAVMTGVVPFAALDIIKAVGAAYVSRPVRKALARSGGAI